MCKKMCLLISLVSLLGLVQASTANGFDPNTDPNLIGWWKLDETSGTIAADSSSNGNDGALMGDPQWVSGWINGALNLDGDGDYVDCGYDPIFDIATNEMTVAAWVTIRSNANAWQVIAAKGEYAWRLSAVNMDPRFHFGITWWDIPSTFGVDGVTSVGYDEWHHVAGSFDGTNINVYLDGVLDASATTTEPIGTNTESLLIGNNPYDLVRYWDGLIDDVRIYGRALSQSEIRDLMPTQLKATFPNPVDGAIISTTAATLSWRVGESAIRHHVYFGENFENVNNGTGDTDKGLIDVNSYSPQNLETDSTYYWRIEEALADGTTIHPGDVWSFAILPKTASNPVPSNGAEYVDPTILLEWTEGADATEHHVYFGDNLQNVEAGTGGTDKGTVVGTTYNPGPLNFGKVYYWRIDVFDGTATHTGEIWSFTTAGPSDGVKGQYYNNITLTGQPVLTRTDYTIDFDWGDDSPDILVNTDNFSVRWTTELDVPFTETYTFITNSDDGVRLWVDGELIIENWTVHAATEDQGTIDLVAGQSVSVLMEYYESGGGAVASLSWQSPSIPRQIIPTSVLSLPVMASGPNPTNGATGIRQTPTLRWTAGDKAAEHDVYFGDDPNNVENADTTTTGIYRGRQVLDNTKYIPTEAPLEWNKTYYWRIDEYNTDATTNKGNVWSFTTANYIILEDFEDYNDVCNRIFFTWADGAGHSGSTTCGIAPSLGNGTGSMVGWGKKPFVEQLTIHSGGQSMPLFYDNSVSPYYSEATRTWDTPQDWTEHDVAALIVWFHGMREYVGGISYDSATQTYTMTGSGEDIEDLTDPRETGFHDEFHFAYTQLSGVGSIIAKVENVVNTNEWAKAGVMIRETLDANSPHAMVVITPAQGVAFQYRIEKAGEIANVQQTDVNAPHWVKLTRYENTFTAQHSADGQNWVDVQGDLPSTIDIPMNVNTYIGLALTSHDALATGEAVFSNVSTTGTVSPTGPFTTSQDIGIASNSADRLYVIVEDDAGHSKLIEHSEPNGTQHTAWQEWGISLLDINDAGVDLKSIKKMYIGVGDRNNPASGGTGRLYIDDIRLYERGCILSQRSADFAKADYAPAGNPAGDCVIDYQEIEMMARDWLVRDVITEPGTVNLIAYYPLDETSGTTVADASGNGNDGTLMGNPQWVPGMPLLGGSALDLDGSGDYVNCGYDQLFDMANNEITVAAWVTIRAIGGEWRAAVAKGESAWRLGNVNLDPRFHFGITVWNAPDTASVDGVTAVGYDEWHHIAGTFNGANINVYLDGVLDASAITTEPIGTNSLNVLIGDNPEATGRYWDGLIDDVRIYDYALSQSEIAYLASAGATGGEVYIPLSSPAELYEAEPQGSRVVNFMDFAVLMKMWLEEQLWPQL